MNLSTFTSWVLHGERYNFWIEVCALVFLVCLLIRFVVARKFLSKVNIIFGAAIVCGILDLSLDILGSILIDNYMDVAPGLIAFVNGSFYFFQVCFPCLLYLFLIYIAAISRETRKKLFFFFIPAVLYLLVIITNPFTHLVFSVDYSLPADQIFVHPPTFYAIWGVAIFYVGLTFSTLILLRNKIEKQLVTSMLFSIAFIVITFALQLIFDKYLLTGLAISLSCWANYEHLANASDMVDKVSGVYNYNAFLNYLKGDIHFEKKQYMIVCLIGNVTQINSTFGILTGNHVYKEIGNYFSSLDNGKCWVFRLSNSRFVLSFKEEMALKIALDELETKFEQPWKVDGLFFDISCNGYYINGDIHARNVSDYMDFVNSLETRVRKTTPAPFICVDQEHIEQISRAKEIENALRTAMDAGFKGFEMYYQPIYQIDGNGFNHSEALIRFTDETLGRLDPQEFIPIAETCGLAQKIDRYVLRTTCEFMRKNPNIDFLDINISGAEFFNNPSEEFIKTVKEFGVNPKKICFEVTETATVAYPIKLEEFMRDMTAEGFSFAIDDFGTGYSNISRIISKSFSIVKLDKSFLTVDDKMEKILKSVISLLHNLHIPIVIEGVETEEQYKYMKELGVQYIQGFYFSKALPESDFLEFIKAK